MVYHETRQKEDKVLNYLIHNSRAKFGNKTKWVKTSKYLGEGKLTEKEIKSSKSEFELHLKQQKKYRYLSSDDIVKIETINGLLKTYFEKAGVSGTEKFKEWFSTELTYNSNAIEGNTLSLKDTSLIINEGIAPKGASLREIHEARNHKDAIEFIEYYKGKLTEEFIRQVHKHILKNIDDANAGTYRNVKVFIRGSDTVLPPETLVPKLMKDLVVWYKKNKREYHAFELAAIVSMKFVSIHPFTDGNGRVSRLIMNFILKKNKYSEINIYLKDRADYMSAVRLANDKNYEPIIKFLVKTLNKNYKSMGTV